MTRGSALAIDELRALADRTRPLTLSKERVLPVRADLAALMPLGGVRRGTVVDVESPALLFALLATATQEGSWAALVGAPSLGLAAAGEHGVAIERIAVVTMPPAAPPADMAATVVAALIDALDVVVLGPRVIGRAADARRLTARARERGGVVMSMGGWPEAVDMKVRNGGNQWAGPGRGHGHLQGWDVDVVVEGRGAASRGRRGWVSLVVAPGLDTQRADGQRADERACDPTVPRLERAG